MKLSPVHEFALKAALWLPLSFVVWFGLAPLWVLPPTVLARKVLLGVWPGLFTALVQGGDLLDASGRVVAHAGYLLTLTTSVLVQVPASAGSPGGAGVLEPTLNPMIYAYSLPLFSGLAMATPLTTRRRLFEMAIAFVVIWLAQAFGIVAESLKFVAIEAGPEGAAATAKAGLSPSAIALAYQFGNLILPAVVPAALWIGLNRSFIERLVGRGGEPGVQSAV
ncbi:MAG TPA: exosortase H-associated membrane protein [Rhodanobacteraceae bacterium]|nr:exosortase H-associated membrane protein [Rhodanobacteraceae bacterium]